MKKLAPFIVIVTFALATMACGLPSISFGSPFDSSTATPEATAIPPAVIAPTPSSANNPPSTGNPSSPVVVTGSLDSVLENLYTRVSPGVVSILVMTAQGGAQGSGIVFDKQGHIVTNDHVVDGATEIEVDFTSGLKVSGDVIGTDIDSDLAVIRVNAPESQLTPLVMGDSDAVREGNRVVTLSRDGTFLSSAAGEISYCDHSYWALGTQKTKQAILTAMRTTASLPRQATGGALIDTTGHLIAVMGDFRFSTKRATSVDVTGRDAAAAVGYFRQLVPDIQQRDQHTASAWLGVGGDTVTPDLGPALGTRGVRGALVEFVTPGSPADKAGIVGGRRVKVIRGKRYVVGGDVIVDINGAAVRSIEDLPRVIGQIGPGRTVSFHLLRGQSSVTVKVKLVANPLRT